MIKLVICAFHLVLLLVKANVLRFSLILMDNGECCEIDDNEGQNDTCVQLITDNIAKINYPQITLNLAENLPILMHDQTHFFIRSLDYDP